MSTKEKIYWNIWLEQNKYLTNRDGRVLQFTTKQSAFKKCKLYKGSTTCRGGKIQNSVIINH